jgi:putative ABC transport system permease protein
MYGATLLLALREMRRHLMRSFLTTLGIIIGIAGVVTMVTLGKGVTASVAEQINSFGSNSFFIIPVPAQEGSAPKPLKQADVEAIQEQIAGVRAAAGQVQRNATAFHNGQNWAITIEGVTAQYMDARSIKIDEGRRFTPAEEASGANDCIIGPTVRDKIFVAGQSPVGEQMRLNNVSCTVVGVFKSRSVGGSNQDQDNYVLMPIKNVQRRFLGNEDLGFIIVSYDAGYDSKVMQSSLVELMRERRLVPPGEDPDFELVDTAQANEAIGTTLALMTAMVAAIAGIALIVSGIGIMNIMLVSVTERTREIGIRLAIGARAREVRLQFLAEAVVLCCFGGVLGLLLALGISWLLATKAMNVPFIFDPVSNVVAFVFCALFGIVFGYYPARRASKLDPIDALRHE